VSAERSWPSLEGDELIISERPQGNFRRQLILGDNLDTEQIVATHDQGVLTIKIPVTTRSQPRKVPVTREEPAVGASPSPSKDQRKHGLLHRHPTERPEAPQG
jgi:HSP20 family protein